MEDDKSAKINPTNKLIGYGDLQLMANLSGHKNSGIRNAINEAKKKRNEYEFINGSYLTPSELKIRRKTKKSKGGKNIRITDFPISAAEIKTPENQKSILEQILFAPKKKKNQKNALKKRAALKTKKAFNGIYGYSELEEILKADDSIIDNPNRDILEWADSILNPDEIYNFADELSTDKEDEEDFEVSDEDEIEYIPSKSQNRVGICPKCSSTKTLVNFVWECQCLKKKQPLKWDISDNFYNIVNDWANTKNFENNKRSNKYEKQSYASAAKSKIYEKKKVHRGRNINFLTNQLEAVTLNEILKGKKKPILRSLLEDDETLGLSNSSNYTQATTFYDLIHESESPFSTNYNDFDLQYPRALKPAKSDEFPLLHNLLTTPSTPSASITRTQTSRSIQTNPSSESPTTSEFNNLKAELEKEKIHRMAVEAKVAALEMKFSQCLSLLEDTVPSLTAKLENISLTCNHFNVICETAKAEKFSALEELNAAKERISKLENKGLSFMERYKKKYPSEICKEELNEAKERISENEGLTFTERYKKKYLSEISEVTTPLLKDDSKNVEEEKEEEEETKLEELNAKTNDDDDIDSQYSFVF
uniref:Uncharacterized protein n=1 Tax=Panagrolaimus davidi TaxID=227884 RepID=A0A914QEV4_9BILA